MAGPFLATQVSAAPDMRVAYVDMQKAISASKAGQEAQKKYEVSLKKAQSGIDAKKVDFEARENFTKQKQSLNAKALSEKQEQLINLAKKISSGALKILRMNSVVKMPGLLVTSSSDFVRWSTKSVALMALR